MRLKRLYSLLFLLIPLIPLAQTKSNIDTVRINHWIELGDSLSQHVHPDAFKYSDSAIVYSRRINYDKGLAYGYMTRGLCYDFAGKLDAAMSDYDSAVVLFKQIHYNKGTGQAISNKGVALIFVGRYDDALTYLLESLPYMKKANYFKGVASVLNNLGLIARRKNEYTKALDYYKQSIEYKEKINDQKGLVTTYLNISSMYYYLDDFENSYKYNQLSSQLALEIEDRVTFAENEVHRATLLHEAGKPAQAIIVFKQAIELLNELGRYKTLVVAYNGIADAYLIDGLTDSAEVYFKKSLKVLDEIDVTLYRMETYRGLSEVYYASEQYRLSRDYLNQYIELKDEIEANSKSEDVKELEAKYNYLSQKERIDRLKKDAEIQELKEKRSAFIQQVLWIASVALLLIIIYIVFLYSNLRKQKLRIDQALSDKELLLKEIHHRVKNNLQMVSSLLYLQADNVKDDSALEAINLSRSRVESMAIIHQELYKEDEITGVEAATYITNLIEAILDTMEFDEDDIHVDKEIQSMVLDIDTMIPLGLIMNELITNTFKHAYPPEQKDKQLTIRLKETGQQLILEIEDNGQGNALQNKKHSTGFGTRLVDLFLKKLKATKTIQKENGYLVHIEINKYSIH